MTRIANFQDFYFSGLLLVASLVIVAVASLTAPAPASESVNGLCFSALDSDFKRENRESWNKVDVIASVVVVALVVAAYAYFWTWLK